MTALVMSWVSEGRGEVGGEEGRRGGGEEVRRCELEQPG